MKKILFAATITDHFYYFHLPYLKYFHDIGWEVHVAGRGSRKLPDCDFQYDIPFERSPFSKGNIEAYKQLKKVIDDNDFDIIHCHTPMGGMLARIAASKKRKNGTKVIYTAHGFHFYKGAPFLNWAIYFPIEWIMSRITDCLITINQEDYDLACKQFKKPTVKLVDGVGYNNDLFFSVSKEEKNKIRKEKGFFVNDKLLIYVAELNANKNQSMLIRMMSKLKTQNVKLLLAGADNFNGEYQKLAKNLGIEEKVFFLGHREDVEQLLKMSDICVASSLREGLPVNIMEAMAVGLPVVAGDNRGHRSLISNEVDGFIVNPNDCDEAAQKIDLLFSNQSLYGELSKRASENIKRFSKETVFAQMKTIYSDLKG
ncbi:MAG: glycosyltransferase family 4 protein [Clostridia bacterium]|nr:glycosyltransferase family 4 protein [Clostridia bacterium]